MFKVIRRPSTPELFRDELVRMVNERFEYSAKFFSSVRTKLPRFYDVWRGIYTGRYHPHRNNVHIPLIYAAIWADAAKKTSASLNQSPIVEFRGYGPDDKAVSLKNETLLTAQFKDANAFIKEVNTHVCAGLYGVAVSKVMWDRRWQQVKFDEYRSMPVGGQVRNIQSGYVCTFDGPNWTNQDLLDTYPQPGVKLIPDMDWIGDRYYLDLDQVRSLSRPDPGGSRPAIFDPAEVARMEREGAYADKASDDAAERRYASRLGMSDDMARILDTYSRPVELREYWGVVPTEYAVDGCTNLVITVANRSYLMRARANPFWHLQKPYVSHAATPDTQTFFPAGKAEVAERMQLTANRYINQLLDAADLRLDPQWFYDRNAGIVTDKLYAKPGQWIGTDGPPADKIMAMPFDDRGFGVGVNLTNQMRQYIDIATGDPSDTVQGMGGGPDRETARAFLGRREDAGSRLMLESRLYEEAYLEPLANMCQRNNRQFLEGPVEVFILGDSAKVDPDTGGPVQDSREVLEGHELAFNYQARAVGATSNLSKMIRRQELIPLLQAVSANPYAAQAINFVNFFRQIFREFDFDNVNELLKQNAQANTNLAQVAETAAQGGSTNPAGIPDTAAGGGANMRMAQILGQ